MGLLKSKAGAANLLPVAGRSFSASIRSSLSRGDRPPWLAACVSGEYQRFVNSHPSRCQEAPGSAHCAAARSRGGTSNLTGRAAQIGRKTESGFARTITVAQRGSCQEGGTDRFWWSGWQARLTTNIGAGLNPTLLFLIDGAVSPVVASRYRELCPVGLSRLTRRLNRSSLEEAVENRLDQSANPSSAQLRLLALSSAGS